MQEVSQVYCRQLINIWSKISHLSLVTLTHAFVTHSNTCQILHNYDVKINKQDLVVFLNEHTSDREWPRVTTNDKEWLQVTASNYEWPRMSTSDQNPKRLRLITSSKSLKYLATSFPQREGGRERGLGNAVESLAEIIISSSIRLFIE